MKPKRGRRTLRETLEANHRALSFYAAGFDKPSPEKPKILQEMDARAARRAPRSRPGADGRPLEKHVLKAVIAAFRSDRRVARVDRNQSGVFQDGNRYIRVGSRGKLDLTVYLKDGRYLEVEVKRERDEALLRDAQKLRISQIRGDGGLAGWCWSVESALALLP